MARLARTARGIVTNQTGVTSRLETTVDAIRRNPEIALRAIYAPEHGFRGDRPAGAYVPSYTDPQTNLPVYSLYGATRHPGAAMLSGVDVLLFDIQDVGDRAYTYISTLAYVMQAARETQKEVWVLDRPNPIGTSVKLPYSMISLMLRMAMANISPPNRKVRYCCPRRPPQFPRRPAYFSPGSWQSPFRSGRSHALLYSDSSNGSTC